MAQPPKDMHMAENGLLTTACPRDIMEKGQALSGRIARRVASEKIETVGKIMEKVCSIFLSAAAFEADMCLAAKRRARIFLILPRAAYK